MTLKNIFDVPSGTATRPIVDTVGRFRSGHQLNKRPIALQQWRVTSDDPSITDQIGALYGGTSQTWDSEKEPYEVFTKAETVNILVDPDAVHTGMVLYGRAGAIRRCDGQSLTYPKEQSGTACACAAFTSLAERKAAAQNGTGCSPEIIIKFKLDDAAELGYFKFITGSWSMARDIVETEERLRSLTGTHHATLTLEPVSFTTKEGVARSFTKPVLTIGGPAQ
jgi:hypothetical protein